MLKYTSSECINFGVGLLVVRGDHRSDPGGHGGLALGQGAWEKRWRLFSVQIRTVTRLERAASISRVRGVSDASDAVDRFGPPGSQPTLLGVSAEQVNWLTAHLRREPGSAPLLVRRCGTFVLPVTGGAPQLLPRSAVPRHPEQYDAPLPRGLALRWRAGSPPCPCPWTARGGAVTGGGFFRGA